jgi:outer membrane lipoprotein-sorting protein
MYRQIAMAAIALSLTIPFYAKADNSVATPAVSKLSAAQIVEKNVAARGGLQAWRSVNSLTMTGRMEAGGNNRSTLPVPGARRTAQMPPPRPTEQVELPFVMELKRPHKLRLELQVKNQTAIQAFDGMNGWKLRPFLGRNDVEPFSADEVKAALMQSELDGPLVDYAAKGTKVELEGMEKVGEQNTYKLKLTMKDGQVRHIWIDSETFLDIKIDGIPRRMDGRMHPVEVYLKDYRATSGVLLPHLLETEVQGLKPTHKMTIQSVVVNPKLDDSLFAKPKVGTTTVPARASVR